MFNGCGLWKSRGHLISGFGGLWVRTISFEPEISICCHVDPVLTVMVSKNSRSFCQLVIVLFMYIIIYVY